MTHCPPLADLEDFIAGRSDVALSSHVSSCSRCETTVAGLRENLVLAAQVRSMLQAPPPALETAEPPTLAGFRLLHLLNEGAQGVVYKAIQESTRRAVAIKFLHHGAFSTARQRLRFEREIDLAASLRHPGIVTVHESGTTAAGQLYCVMEFVDGLPIHDFVRSARGSVRDVVGLFTRVCQAVHHAHQHGVLHRDLKPSNVFVDRQGEPRVLDFGLARALDAEDPEQASQSAALTTRAGEFLGTLAYASPEQLEADPGRIDVRSDVYSLGVILYELIAGRRPYETSGNVAASVRTILEVVPTPPSRLGAASDRDLDTIALRALAKDRERRYGSAADFAADLQNWTEGRPIEARRDSTLYVLRKTLRRHWIVSSAIALVCVVSLSAAVISNHFRGIANAETARAEKRLAQIENGVEILGSIFKDLDPIFEEQDGRPLRVLLGERLEEAASQLEAESVGDPTAVARLQRTLGSSLLALGYPVQAVELYLKAHATFTAQLGPDHGDTLGNCTNIGLAYRTAGKIELALQQFEEALERTKAKYGPVDPMTLSCMQNLGSCYQRAGKFDLALPMLEETLELRKAALGRSDRLTLTTMNNLGAAYLGAGELDLAVSMCEQTFKLAQEYSSTDHPIFQGSLNNLALSYMEVGKLHLAVPLLEEALDLLKSQLGPDHYNTLTAMSNLASAYWDGGRMDAALALLQQAAASVEKRNFAHEYAGRILYNLSICLEQQLQYEPAEAWRRKRLAMFEDNVAADPLTYAEALASLGLNLMHQARWADAETMLRKSLAIRESRQPDVWETYNLQAVLGGVLLIRKQYDDAEPFLLEGTAGLLEREAKIPKAERRCLVQALQWLVDLYDHLGDAAEKARWQEELEAERTRPKY